jgi:hypothetical protein
MAIRKFLALHQIRTVMGDRQLSKSARTINILIRNQTAARARSRPNIKIRRIRIN